METDAGKFCWVTGTVSICNEIQGLSKRRRRKKQTLLQPLLCGIPRLFRFGRYGKHAGGAVKNVWRISDTLIAPIRGTGSRLRSEVRISVVSTIMNNTSIPAGQPSETKRGPATSASHSKTTARYRKSRVYLPVSGRNTKSPFYCMQCRNGGKRATLGLRTANKEIAAKKAAQIFFDVLLLGMDAAIEKHRKRACRGTG